MNRWKREFREWVRREGLVAYSMPLNPRDWRVAKQFSILCDSIARTDAFNNAMVDYAERLLYGEPNK